MLALFSTAGLPVDFAATLEVNKCEDENCTLPNAAQCSAAYEKTRRQKQISKKDNISFGQYSRKPYLCTRKNGETATI